MPGTGATLPPLTTNALVTTALPYPIGPDEVALYTAPFTVNNTSTPWTGPAVVASMSVDRRTGLFALPLFSGAGALFGPATPGGPGPADAMAAMLVGLDFPSATRAASPRLARR